MKNIKGVITADIVGSTLISEDKRELLPKLLYELAEELKGISPIRLEIFRGDSFQILVEDASKAPLVAILFRAGLRKSKLLETSKLLDARMSIGIGTISYIDEKLSMSDGQAFVYSGREFDELHKRRLSITTQDSNINGELLFSTAFVDDIVSHWTCQQSECIFDALVTDNTHELLAKKMNTSRQNVSKKLSAAKENLVRLYLDRVSELIERL